MKVKSQSEVAQSCPTLSDPMDCSLPGSSIHGIFQARILEWGAIAFSILAYRRCLINICGIKAGIWLWSLPPKPSSSLDSSPSSPPPVRVGCISGYDIDPSLPSPLPVWVGCISCYHIDPSLPSPPPVWVGCISGYDIDPSPQALLQSGLDVSQAMTLTPPSQALLQSGLGVSSVLAWRIPGTGEPGGLPSMGSHRVGHNWSDLAAAAAGYDIDPFPPSPPPVWVGCISGSEFGRGFLQLLWSPCSRPRLTWLWVCSRFQRSPLQSGFCAQYLTASLLLLLPRGEHVLSHFQAPNAAWILFLSTQWSLAQCISFLQFPPPFRQNSV